MKWNDHKNLEGCHAFLSASRYTWLRKDADELVESYRNSFAQTIGTLVHAYAADYIRFRERMLKGDKRALKIELLRNGVPDFAIDIDAVFPTVMQYVNDAVGYLMYPEVVLYWSDLCYGTADAICLDGDILRIHDLKTGTTLAKMDQLLVYAGLFCLEYGYSPEKLKAELRIYQLGDRIIYEPEPAEIRDVMDSIMDSCRVLQKIREV